MVQFMKSLIGAAALAKPTTQDHNRRDLATTYSNSKTTLSSSVGDVGSSPDIPTQQTLARDSAPESPNLETQIPTSLADFGISPDMQATANLTRASHHVDQGPQLPNAADEPLQPSTSFSQYFAPIQYPSDYVPMTNEDYNQMKLKEAQNKQQENKKLLKQLHVDQNIMRNLLAEIRNWTADKFQLRHNFEDFLKAYPDYNLYCRINQIDHPVIAGYFSGTQSMKRAQKRLGWQQKIESDSEDEE